MKLTYRDRKGKEYAEMAYIKNMDHEKVLNLTGEVEVAKGQVVSKTLAQNDAVSITLFAFSKGEEIGGHDSEGDAMVQVIEGTGRFTVGGTEHIVHAGEVLIMPAKIRHAVYAVEDFKMLLTVVFPA
jgi:quercetin dioxygenase-like cupin family protein